MGGWERLDHDLTELKEYTGVLFAHSSGFLPYLRAFNIEPVKVKPTQVQSNIKTTQLKVCAKL